MIASSRRNFLKSATVVTGGALVTVGLGATTAHAAEPESSEPAHPDSFVAWVTDPRAGAITVLVDQHELVITDKKLARKLAQAAARAVATN